MLFFKVFRDALFFLKYLPHFWQCNALNVFSIWIITYIKLGVSHLWKKFQDEIVHQRTFTKKTPNFFWLLLEDIKIPYTFYKIQNFRGTPWASIITTCLIKLFRTWPLATRPIYYIGNNDRLCVCVFLPSARIQNCMNYRLLVEEHFGIAKIRNNIFLKVWRCFRYRDFP